METRVLEFTVHRENGSYWAQNTEMPNLITAADNLDELLVMLTDMLNTVLEETLAYETAAPDGPQAIARAQAQNPEHPQRYLTRVVRIDIEVQEDLRSDAADNLPGAPPKRRQRTPHRRE